VTHHCPITVWPTNISLCLADCFQEEKLIRYAEIGESLLNILGAVICGSQVAPESVSSPFLCSPFSLKNRLIINLTS